MAQRSGDRDNSDRNEKLFNRLLIDVVKNPTPNLKKLSFYVEQGADVNCRDEDERPVLHWAVINNNTEVIELLLDSNAEVDQEDSSGATCLHYASLYSHTSTMKLLTERGAEVDFMDLDYVTPLHKAAENGATDAVNMLIKCGVCLDSKDQEGATPLHYACSNGFVACANTLALHKASVNAKDNAGNTPLHDAANGGHFEVLKILLSHGADVNAARNDRSTALDIAERIEDMLCAELLRERGGKSLLPRRRGASRSRGASATSETDDSEMSAGQSPAQSPVDGRTDLSFSETSGSETTPRAMTPSTPRSRRSGRGDSSNRRRGRKSSSKKKSAPKVNVNAPTPVMVQKDSSASSSPTSFVPVSPLDLCPSTLQRDHTIKMLEAEVERLKGELPAPSDSGELRCVIPSDSGELACVIPSDSGELAVLKVRVESLTSAADEANTLLARRTEELEDTKKLVDAAKEASDLESQQRNAREQEERDRHANDVQAEAQQLRDREGKLARREAAVRACEESIAEERMAVAEDRRAVAEDRRSCETHSKKLQQQEQDARREENDRERAYEKRRCELDEREAALNEAARVRAAVQAGAERVDVETNPRAADAGSGDAMDRQSDDELRHLRLVNEQLTSDNGVLRKDNKSLLDDNKIMLRKLNSAQQPAPTVPGKGAADQSKQSGGIDLHALEITKLERRVEAEKTARSNAEQLLHAKVLDVQILTRLVDKWKRSASLNAASPSKDGTREQGQEGSVPGANSRPKEIALEIEKQRNEGLLAEVARLKAEVHEKQQKINVLERAALLMSPGGLTRSKGRSPLKNERSGGVDLDDETTAKLAEFKKMAEKSGALEQELQGYAARLDSESRVRSGLEARNKKLYEQWEQTNAKFHEALQDKEKHASELQKAKKRQATNEEQMEQQLSQCKLEIDTLGGEVSKWMNLYQDTTARAGTPQKSPAPSPVHHMMELVG